MHERVIPSLRQYAIVGLGGMIGAIGRYGISVLFADDAGFPYGTLLTNWIGCLLLSFLLHHRIIKQRINPEIFTGLTVGVIGSFTTFSTVAVDTVFWLTYLPSVGVYVGLTLFGCLLFSFAGSQLATRKQGDL